MSIPSGLQHLAFDGVTRDTLIGYLPPNAIIVFAVFHETTGQNAVSPSMGGGVQPAGFMTAVPVNAGQAYLAMGGRNGDFVKTWFSYSVAQSLWVNAANWNGARLNVVIYYVDGP